MKLGLALVLPLALGSEAAASPPALPSWNDGPAKSAITAFIARVTAEVPAFDVREAAYDRRSPIGKLDRALDQAAAQGWTVVDMKRDWKRVFAFEAP